MKRYIIAVIMILLCYTSSARQVFSLNDEWFFFFKTETSSDTARRISLPHTWNLDALSGQDEYLKTTANYSRNIFIPKNWAKNRMFLKFHGVQSVADVFVNGHHVGEHRGGWTAFTFEITKHLKFGEDNSVVVVVNNAYQNDVLPTSSELNLYGGIYRDVELIVTEQTTISPLYYGSDGVLINQVNVTDTVVDASASVWVTSTIDKLCDLYISVRGPMGDVVYSRYLKEQIKPNEPINIPFRLEEPLLWSCDEPNMYSVSVSIGHNQEDEVVVNTGFRKIEVNAKTGLKINGERMKINGVTLHHDRAVVGSALRTRHYDEDMEKIRDLGATAIRSATAPHAQYLYDICDQNGMLVWIDTPFTRAPYLSDFSYFATKRFHDNSLVWMRGDNVLDFVKELNSTAKQLDSSRPTVACSNQDGDINFVPDLIVWQQNLGWDKGAIKDLEIWNEKQHTEWGHLRSAVAYGEAGSIHQQANTSLKPMDIDQRWLPERWQTEFHEGYVKYMAQDSIYWGMWINDMFEFGSVRHEDGIARRGLVTFDRNDEKDSYYLYRTLWNKKSPTLHIIEKRRNIRMDTIQQIKFYSSAKEAPVMIVNKDTIKVKEYAPKQFISDSIIMHGRNTVVVKAGELKDQQIITIGNTLKSR